MGEEDVSRPTVTISNNIVTGGKYGIHIDPGTDAVIQGNTFRNVETPFHIPDSNARISGTRIYDDPKHQASTAVGWSRPKGPPLPSFCPSCKRVFQSENYVFSGMYWKLWDNTEPCPNCGFKEARLSEGVFNLVRDLAEIISAPDMTHVMVREIQQVLTEPSAATMTVDEVVAAIVRIAPQLSQTLPNKSAPWEGASYNQRAFWVSVIALLVAIFAAIPGWAPLLKSEDKPAVTRDQLMANTFVNIERLNIEASGSDAAASNPDDNASHPLIDNAAVELRPYTAPPVDNRSRLRRDMEAKRQAKAQRRR